MIRINMAKYSLNAPDHARINRKHPLKVTLPDNTTLMQSFDIVLERNGDKVPDCCEGTVR